MNAGQKFSPQIAVSGNNVYVVWTDKTPGNFDILFKRSTDRERSLAVSPPN